MLPDSWRIATLAALIVAALAPSAWQPPLAAEDGAVALQLLQLRGDLRKRLPGSSQNRVASSGAQTIGGGGFLEEATARVAKNATGTCSPMKNMGSHFTVEIEVGTPGQKFQVVADTGSDSVIVPSCACMDAGKCSPKDRCFRGTNKSSTFSTPAPQSFVTVVFGSGSIAAALATDDVRVGTLKAEMDNGVLLMVDRALVMEGPFEGILGLGLPPSGEVALAETPPAGAHSNASSLASNGSGVGRNENLTAHLYRPKLFAEAAGIDHFSVCFKDNGEPGVLRLGDAPAKDALATTGHAHWGLGFQGVGVGNASAPAAFCGEANASSGQRSACGAILDSGTTAMMGPKDHILSLFEFICGAWPRCNALNNSSGPNNSSGQKAILFQELLLNCSDWLTEDKGLHELPSLHFQLAGPDGKARAFELSGWAYVNEVMQEEVKMVRKYLAGIIPVNVAVGTGHKKKVCMPSFGVMDLAKGLNRTQPVWILGTPFFYEYIVGYDLSANPPALSLTSQKDSECGTCDKNESLVQRGAGQGPTAGARPPRLVSGPWRVASPFAAGPAGWPADVSQPL